MALGAISSVVSMGAAAVAQNGPVFDVPRLDKIVIDGKADDWGDSGFKVEALAPVNGGLRAASDFAASFRLGWNERGLLLLTIVRDNDLGENKDTKALWQKDSLELFWGGKVGVRDWVQLHVGPGVGADTPEIRINVDDHRESATLSGIPVNAQIARTKIPGGYVLEALLPWDCLKIVPAKGREAAFQFVANDVDKDGPRAQLMWFPEEGAYSDPAKMQTIRLSDKASPAVTIAALPNYDAFPRTRLSLVAPEGMAGKTIAARDGKTALGSATLKAAGGWATGDLILRGVPKGVVTLSDGGPLALRDAATLRKAAFERADVRFRPAPVFTGNALPSADFGNPERMEAIIGPYSLETTYYDAAMNHVTIAAKNGRYAAVMKVRSVDGKYKATQYFTLYRAPNEPDWNNWDGDFSLPLAPAFGIDPAVVKNQMPNADDFLKELFLSGMESGPFPAIYLAGLSETAPTDPPVQRLNSANRDRDFIFALRRKLGDAPAYKYIVAAPKDYAANADKKYPLLLFLHGAGERGDDVQLAATHGPLKYLREGHELPFLIVNPQCPVGEWWHPARVMALLDEVEAKYRVDKSRIYLTGLSMGGFGSWATGLQYPDRFAAIAPICGGGDPADAARLLNTPLWDFHGGKDTVVPILLSEQMIEALKKAGAKDVQFTVYPEAGHDSWTETYNNPKLYEWFLKYSK